MSDIYCYSYVEDQPSAAIIKKLVDNRNAFSTNSIIFIDGFPDIKRGYSAIKNKAPSLLKMARIGIYSLSLTDLDMAPCASELIRNWFFPNSQLVALPKTLFFRIAVREIESWILADKAAFADFMGIPRANFSNEPDKLRDPEATYIFRS